MRCVQGIVGAWIIVRIASSVITQRLGAPDAHFPGRGLHGYNAFLKPAALQRCPRPPGLPLHLGAEVGAVPNERMGAMAANQPKAWEVQGVEYREITSDGFYVNCDPQVVACSQFH